MAGSSQLVQYGYGYISNNDIHDHNNNVHHLHYIDRNAQDLLSIRPPSTRNGPNWRQEGTRSLLQRKRRGTKRWKHLPPTDQVNFDWNLLETLNHEYIFDQARGTSCGRKGTSLSRSFRGAIFSGAIYCAARIQSSWRSKVWTLFAGLWNDHESPYGYINVHKCPDCHLLIKHQFSVLYWQRKIMTSSLRDLSIILACRDFVVLSFICRIGYTFGCFSDINWWFQTHYVWWFIYWKCVLN